jgi:hypothetical protein
MVFADCDLRRGLHAKRWFDAVGHYSGGAPLGLPEHPAPSAATPPQNGDEDTP